MTNDEIRKLLAGYATNTLTETERQALFEAALDDQELFDALHQEQALRELLDDPVSRVQIRQAMEKEPAASWLSRWWTWAAAASAVAAAVLIVAVMRTHAPELHQKYASVQESKPAAAQPPEKVASDAEVRRPAPARITRARSSGSVSERKDALQSQALPVPAPAPTAPPAPPAAFTPPQQVQLDGQAPAPSAAPGQGRAGETQAQSQQALGGAVNSLRDQRQNQTDTARFNVAITGALLKSVLAPVGFTVLKRDSSGVDQPLSPDAGLKPGDAVRLRVVPVTSGYLSLSRQDAAGQWTRVFPETGPGLSVSANANYTIPVSAIEVTQSDQRLRLTLIPASVIGVSSSGQIKAKAAPLKKESAVNPPLFVDLIIGPKSVP